MFLMRTLTTHSLMSWGLLQPQWKLAGVPAWLSLPRNRWPKDWEKKCWQPTVPVLLALYGHPGSGGIWEQHPNSRVVKQGWKQILPDIWHSIFHHEELNCPPVVYLDDFKMAGPSVNLPKAWASIKAAVDIGEPEAYDRYFGCMHREFANLGLAKEAHPFDSPLKPSHPLSHNTGHRTGGNMMKTTKHGLDATSNPEKDYTSRVMRREREREYLSKFKSHNFLRLKGHIQKLS